MKKNDIVDLVFVVGSGCYAYGHRTTCENACDMIRAWWKCRDNARKGDEDAKRWLQTECMALNAAYEDSPEETFCGWCVAWEHVRAMYIAPSVSTHEKLQQSQEELVSLIKKQIREEHRGDDWRGEDDPT